MNEYYLLFFALFLAFYLALAILILQRMFRSH